MRGEVGVLIPAIVDSQRQRSLAGGARYRWKSITLLVCLLLSSFCSWAAESTYRTDSGGDEKLSWYELKAGEFPPEDAAHYIGGELIGYDHINRTGRLRIDRTDAIRRGDWDQALPFTLLPYAIVSYHGAPAELRDIPIGTHLHGFFFWEPKAGKDGKGAFTKAARLEDDFSHSARLAKSWKVQDLQMEKGVFDVHPNDAADGAKPVAFQILPATRVWRAKGFATLDDLAPGQALLVNLTYCTLKGPGRCTDIWIDDESRALAKAHQLEVHRQFQHEHGLPAWVTAVDNHEGIVTATLFANTDPKLLADFIVKESMSAVVSEPNLRTYDQGSDRMGGALVDLQKRTPSSLGDSGVEIKYKPTTLLEGFRPQRIIRVFSGRWKVDEVPKEERLYPPEQ
jgi:hypothetical protein